MDAPTYWGTRAELVADYGADHGAEAVAPERFDRADAHGTSCRIGGPGHWRFGWQDNEFTIAHGPGSDRAIEPEQVAVLARSDVRAYCERYGAGDEAGAAALCSVISAETGEGHHLSERPMTGDRISFDHYADTRYSLDHRILDEIVTSHASVHLEQMSTHTWWCHINLPGGGFIELDLRDVRVIEMGGPLPPVTVSPLVPGLVHWIDGAGREHLCDDHEARVCRCECGAEKPGGAT
ncbi:hypothetical protein [Nakamurella aerolata]|uniref:Uncharacterized protein n=1 Tax=Nakamurella aerolata TaxID=1656892 RepID=A0A849AAD1_9ACTN|nr:hypothetical protein [Nakamurella aerolata]NNG36917.1 hypothetical protein [Nakamurella aerolata]